MAHSPCTRASQLTSGARRLEYGGVKESFEKWARIANELFDDMDRAILSAGVVSPVILCKIMQAQKLQRESNKHKDDNLDDLCGYTELLAQLRPSTAHPEDDSARLTSMYPTLPGGPQ